MDPKAVFGISISINILGNKKVLTFYFIYNYFMITILLRNIILLKHLTINVILKKNILYLFIYFFINFYLFQDIAYCEANTDTQNSSLGELTKNLNEEIPDENNIIQKIMLTCILSAFIIGAIYLLTDGFDFPGSSNNNYGLTEEKLERIKITEEAQKKWMEKWTIPKNIEYARISPYILYNCDIPPGAWRDIGLYDELY